MSIFFFWFHAPSALGVPAKSLDEQFGLYDTESKIDRRKTILIGPQ